MTSSTPETDSLTSTLVEALTQGLPGDVLNKLTPFLTADRLRRVAETALVLPTPGGRQHAFSLSDI